MRLPMLLICLAVASAVAAFVAYRASVRGAITDEALLASIPELPARFASSAEPTLTLSLNDLPQWNSDPILVDKVGAHIESRQYCDGDLPDTEPDTNKDEIWHEHAVCGATQALPEGFFRRPPYLHLSGHSYVVLALTTDPDRFGRISWLSEHKDFVQVSELPQLARLGVALTAEERLVAGMNEEALRAFAAGVPFIEGQEYVLLAIDQNPEPSARRYNAYPLAAWDAFLMSTPLTTKPRQPGDACLAVVGAACFVPNPKGVEARLNQATVMGTLSMALLACTVLLIGFRRIQAQRREEATRLFVLQTLSHEIRTPATSLALSLEPIRRHFDDLPDAAQPAFLRICDNVQRLQRVVEASRQYLRGQVSGREIQFNKVALPSASRFIKTILERYEPEPALTVLDEPDPVCLDPYWVNVCVRNLVDNAVAHGREPIQVLLSREGRNLTITVQDSGSGLHSSFKEMVKPFHRGDSSEGLGLGLSVVQRLVVAMKGKLRYQTSPTRLSVMLCNVMLETLGGQNPAG